MKSEGVVLSVGWGFLEKALRWVRGRNGGPGKMGLMRYGTNGSNGISALELCEDV